MEAFEKLGILSGVHRKEGLVYIGIYIGVPLWKLPKGSFQNLGFRI